MELSIGQVAKRAGISARMLRHYDDLGLYRPARVSSNGYRWYNDASLPRLYRIVALRRAGLSLTDIAKVVTDERQEADTLRVHLGELRNERDRLEALITAMDAQLEALENMGDPETAMLMENHEHERQGFAARIAAEYGEGVADQITGHQQGELTASDLEHAAAHGTLILNRMSDALRAGIAPQAREAGSLVAEHRAAVKQHTAITPEGYRALAKLYLTDPLQRPILERIDPDLPDWLAAAITHHASDR